MTNNTGIYALTHLDTGNVYVGASTNLSHRKYTHYRNLHLNQHECKEMQSDFNESASGNSAFEFRVVEYCGAGDLAERERIQMETLSPTYNKNAAGGGVRVTVSDEFREKTRERMIGKQIRYIGDFKTPWGTFRSSYQAGLASNGMMSQTAVLSACKGKNNAQINRHAYGKSRYLQETFGESAVGKTWNELGFSFVEAKPAETQKQENKKLSNVIAFPTDNEFEDLSLSERLILIEEFNSEIEENLKTIRESASKIAELIEARKRHDQE